MGSSMDKSSVGHWEIGAVKRAFGCAALAGSPSHSAPFQSTTLSEGLSRPSHHTSPSSVVATLVKMTLLWSVFMAFGLLLKLVPGATPKNPLSGLMA